MFVLLLYESKEKDLSPFVLGEGFHSQAAQTEENSTKLAFLQVNSIVQCKHTPVCVVVSQPPHRFMLFAIKSFKMLVFKRNYINDEFFIGT